MLPLRQLRVLRYLEDRDSTPARDVAADLQMTRADAMNTLRLLAARNLVSADFAVFPASFAITAGGRAFLAAAVAAEGGEH